MHTETQKTHSKSRSCTVYPETLNQCKQEDELYLFLREESRRQECLLLNNLHPHLSSFWTCREDVLEREICDQCHISDTPTFLMSTEAIIYFPSKYLSSPDTTDSICFLFFCQKKRPQISRFCFISLYLEPSAPGLFLLSSMQFVFTVLVYGKCCQISINNILSFF